MGSWYHGEEIQQASDNKSASTDAHDTDSREYKWNCAAKSQGQFVTGTKYHVEQVLVHTMKALRTVYWPLFTSSATLQIFHEVVVPSDHHQQFNCFSSKGMLWYNQEMSNTGKSVSVKMQDSEYRKCWTNSCSTSSHPGLSLFIQTNFQTSTVQASV